MTKIDVHSHVGVDLLFYLDRGYPYAQDLQRLVADGRRNGLDRWVVFSMVTHTALSVRGFKTGKIEYGDDRLEDIPYAWENKRLLWEINELFPELGRCALPFMMIDPGRRQKEQLAELIELRKNHQFYGLKIQGTVIQSKVSALLDEGSCLLDWIEAEQLPMTIHTSVYPGDHWSQVSDILEVARRRPGIRICLAHSCRFDKPGLDEVATLPNTWFDCSAHSIHCHLAAENHPAIAEPSRRFASDYTNPSQVLADLAKAYPSRLMWGSDAPFQSYCSTKSEKPPLLKVTRTYDQEAAPLHDLPKDVQERISYRNTMAFLGLKDLPS